MPKPDLYFFSSMKTSFRQSRAALTLIEMMVSVALTLLVVLAVVRVFDMLGSSVTDSRSILQMSAQLRTVANRLQADLDRLTVRTLPPVDPNSAPGCFELIEGPDRDKFPSWGELHDIEVYTGEHLAKDNNGQPIEEVKDTEATRAYSAFYKDYQDVAGWYGDLDDVLIFTVASDGEPFKGRFANQIVESNYALVIWWVERLFDNGIPKSFRLHRRQLLIVDDPGAILNTPQKIAMTDYLRPGGLFAYKTNVPLALNQFYNLNDVAVRMPTLAEETVAETNRLIFTSLEELSERQNRYGHLPQRQDATTVATPNFPYPFLLPRFVERRVLDGNRYDTEDSWEWFSAHAKRNDLGVGGFAGEDVVMGDLLAFDVRVYDPLAPLQVEAPSPTPLPPNVKTALENQKNSYASNVAYALTPADRGYGFSVLPTLPPPRGAFVDLAYGIHETIASHTILNSNFRSWFLNAPHFKSGLSQPRMAALGFPEMGSTAVYDTWSALYERDGLDQNNDGVDLANNGMDDDGNGIVDDEREQDTVPPYSHPLRGIEVTIRALEVNSEQIRQVSIVANFKDD